jgi:hypothetical protein
MTKERIKTIKVVKELPQQEVRTEEIEEFDVTYLTTEEALQQVIIDLADIKKRITS